MDLTPIEDGTETLADLLGRMPDLDTGAKEET
jgi:hypothetical protein